MDDRHNYEAPETQALELNTEGIFCNSATLNVQYGEEDL